jgi:RND family efflux transporter MFP subunit
LSADIALPAQLTPYAAVDIYPKVTGFIDELPVDRGSRVRTGDLIARLSAPELVAQRAQSDAAVQNSEAKLAADQGTYQHLAEAAKTPGVVAGNDLAIAEQTVHADSAQVALTRDALRSATQLESYLVIRAPFDGVISTRNLNPGALVGPSAGQPGAQPIVRLVDQDRLRLVVPVPEAYIAGVEAGRQLRFTVPAYPGRTFAAPIARIAHDVDQGTRTMAVELDVHNTDRRLTPGTFATVLWSVARPYPTLFVPSTAITTDLERTFVIRVDSGLTDWVDVTTGIADNEATEVFGNLHAGDLVVRNGTDALRPKTPVHAQLIPPARGADLTPRSSSR